MPYYKTLESAVHFLDSAEFEHMLPQGSTGITYEEAMELLPKPEIIPEPAPAPLVVSRFQALAALYQAGVLEDIRAYMALPDTDFLTKLAWEEAQEFHENSPMVASIGELFAFPDEQLTDLFRFASTITA